MKIWWKEGGWRYVFYPVLLIVVVGFWYFLATTIADNMAMRQACVDLGGAWIDGQCLDVALLEPTP